MAAAKEIPRNPAMETWTEAQIRQSIETKGYVDEFEIVDLAEGDELLQRRLKGTEEEVRRFIIEKLLMKKWTGELKTEAWLRSLGTTVKQATLAKKMCESSDN